MSTTSLEQQVCVRDISIAEDTRELKDGTEPSSLPLLVHETSEGNTLTDDDTPEVKVDIRPLLNSAQQLAVARSQATSPQLLGMLANYAAYIRYHGEPPRPSPESWRRARLLRQAALERAALKRKAWRRYEPKPLPSSLLSLGASTPDDEEMESEDEEEMHFGVGGDDDGDEHDDECEDYQSYDFIPSYPENDQDVEEDVSAPVASMEVMAFEPSEDSSLNAVCAGYLEFARRELQIELMGFRIVPEPTNGFET